jgi:hypothetical protein
MWATRTFRRTDMNFFEYTSPRDHVLDPGSEPPIGAHKVTPRRDYAHHGIYVGREHRSYQVDELVARYGRAWLRLIALLARALCLWSTAGETTRAGT